MSQAELIKVAAEAYDSAQSALKNGDWEGYGKYLDQLEKYLNELQKYKSGTFRKTPECPLQFNLIEEYMLDFDFDKMLLLSGRKTIRQIELKQY